MCWTLISASAQNNIHLRKNVKMNLRATHPVRAARPAKTCQSPKEPSYIISRAIFMASTAIHWCLAAKRGNLGSIRRYAVSRAVSVAHRTVFQNLVDLLTSGLCTCYIISEHDLSLSILSKSPCTLIDYPLILRSFTLAEAMCIDAIVSVSSKGRKTPGFRTNDSCLRVKVSDLITLTGH